MWDFITRDRYARIFAAVFALINLPYFIPLLSREDLRFFGNRYYDLINLFLVLIALLGGLRTVSGARERRLWSALATAIGIWFFVRLLLALQMDQYGELGFRMFAGTFYVAFYMALLFAIDARPHLEEPGPRSRIIPAIESAGSLIFVLAMLVYFVIIPTVFDPAVREWWAPHLYLYVVLDLFLMGRLILLAAESPGRRWKVLYGLLAAAAFAWAVTDGLQTLSSIRVWRFTGGTMVDLLWGSPAVFLVAAARLRHYPFAEPQETAARPPDRFRSILSPQLGGRVLIFGFAFPVIHYLAQLLEVSSPSTHDVREALVLGILVVLGGVAAVERKAFLRLGKQLEREREQAEEQTRENVLRLNALLEHSPLGIAVIDPAYRVLLCNPAFTKMFQYSEEEALGRPLMDLVAGDEALKPEVRGIVQRVDDGESVHTTSWRMRKDGTRLQVELFAVPLMPNGTMTGSFVIYQDITERRTREEQAREAQKMEAMGRLAGGVAHDFNNLLMVIRGYTEILPTLTDQPDRFQQYLAEIENAADRASYLTQQLLTFSRDRVVQTRTLDLNHLVAEADSMFRRILGAKVKIRTNLAPDLGAIQANKSQIEQVVVNLLLNAREAMPEGGTVTIVTKNHEVEEGRDQEDARPGFYVMLSIADTGVGFDEETRQHIFDPFFTTKRAQEASGLGLATVYGAAKQMGGFVRAESTPGEGSAFYVYIPMTGARPSPAATRKAPACSIAARGETILVVEDELTVRRLTQHYLESQGYHVLEALESQEALRIVREHAGPIHLLLTDVVLPGLNGPELAERIASLRPETQILLMSGYSDASVLDQWRLAREAAFLQKPFTLESLAKMVRDRLDVAR